MVNPRTTGPYGDIYTAGTPALDRLSIQLYQDEKQRQLLRQRQAAQLDDEFAKNMAGVKDVDVPKIAKKYGDWKIHYQQLQRKGAVTPQEQLENLRKKADIYQAINGSKADMATATRMRQDYYTHPDIYDDNAPNLIAARLKTPTDELATYKNDKGEVQDLTDENLYRYKGTNTDFQKTLTAAAGVPKQVYQEEEPVDKGGLQIKIKPYLFGNTPLQYKQSLLSSLSDRSMKRDAEAIIAQTDPEILKTVDEEYKAIPPERWKKMGVDKPQDLSIDKAQSNAEKYAIHQAQLYALNNEPKEGAPLFRDNKEAIRKDQQAFDLKKLAIQNANAKDLVQMRHDLTKGDKDLEDVWLDTFIGGLKSEALKPGKDKLEFTPKGGGTPIVGPIIEVDPAVSKGLEKQKMQPSDIMVLPDGNFLPIYYKKDTNGERIKGKNGGFTVDTELSTPITQQQLKLALGGKAVSPTQRTKEMLNQPGTTTTKKQYSYKGKTFTPEQIEKAAQQSNLSVDEYLKKYGIK